jgi:hypothetical protein
MGTHTHGEVTDWLLEGDPSIRWQVMRDLLRRPSKDWRREQARVAADGWGARLLGFQDESGRWTARFYGYKWISTTYSMTLLRRLGLPAGDPRALRACEIILDEGRRPDGGIDPSTSLHRSEACVSGMVLGLLAWFGSDDERREQLVAYLLAEQMPDGGWNCERPQGATHSSFHTTVNVLEGLREYAAADGAHRADAEEAEAGGREFLLQHRLYRSHTTGDIVDSKMLRLSFPPRWRYDVLRSLDYFRSADAEPDERLTDAIEIVLGKRRSNGTWPLQQRYAGRTWFEMEPVGEPSRWNTLRALRVLDWWGDGPA